MSTTENGREQFAYSPLSLAGKRVVAVGGKTGIGLGVARAAHAAGASVTVASRRTASAAEHPYLADFNQVTLDISDEAAVRDKTGTSGRGVSAHGPVQIVGVVGDAVER